MEKQACSGIDIKMQKSSLVSLSLEPSLTDLILKPNSEKIRRPPNAFMVFAREQRKTLADRHPDVSNKVISSMLGQMWKNTPENTKAKYYQKSEMLKALHKSQYPGYIYSPREARLKKMKRKMKKDSEDAVALRVIVKKEKPQKANEEESNQEMNRTKDEIPWPEYVPNNPYLNEYFIPENPDLNIDDDVPDRKSLDQCSSNPAFHQENKMREMLLMNKNHEEFQENGSCDWCATSKSYGSCQREQLECKNSCLPSSEEVPFRSPRHLAYAYSSQPTFYSSTGRFPGYMNSFCCASPSYTTSVPRSYAPSFQPYWGPTMMNPRHFQSGDGIYGDVKSCSYPAPYNAHNICRPPLGYLDRPASPFLNTSYASVYRRGNEDWDYLRKCRREFIADNPELRPCRHISTTQKISNLNACNSSDRGPTLQNRCFSIVEERNSLEPISEEMPNLKPFSQFDSSKNQLQSQCESRHRVHSINRNPEARRLETASYKCDFPNRNIPDVTKNSENKNDDSSIGSGNCNMKTSGFENTFDVMTSSDEKNTSQGTNEYDYKNACNKMYSQGPASKFDTHSNVALYGDSKSYIRSTEKPSLVPNNQFQGICYRPLQQTSGNVALGDSNASVINSSFKNKDNSNMHLEPNNANFNNAPAQTNKNTVSAIKQESTPDDETDASLKATQFNFYRPLDTEASSSV